MTEVHTWKWWWWWSSKIARLLLAPALMIFTQFNLSQVAQLLCTLRAPLCDMLACCNIRSRDPTLHTYWWSVPGCNEMMMTTEWSLRSHWTVDSGHTDNTQTQQTREITVSPVTFYLSHTLSNSLQNFLLLLFYWSSWDLSSSLLGRSWEISF